MGPLNSSWLILCAYSLVFFPEIGWRPIETVPYPIALCTDPSHNQQPPSFFTLVMNASSNDTPTRFGLWVTAHIALQARHCRLPSAA